VIALFLALTLIPGDVSGGSRVGGPSRAQPARTRGCSRGDHVAALAAAGVRGALAVSLARSAGARRGRLWAFDIATLWARQAFGGAPAISVVVMAYFVGMFANVLPLPAASAASTAGMDRGVHRFGVNAPVVVVAVLVYRAFAFWLPTVPGAIAYVQPAPSGCRMGCGRAQLDAVGTAHA